MLQTASAAHGCCSCHTHRPAIWPSPAISLPPPPSGAQNREWTTALPKIVRWIRPGSPYYNLISDESQIWQGALTSGRQGWTGHRLRQWGRREATWHAYACRSCLAHRRQRAADSAAAAPPAELNMAYSQHEIVADYVRPTLMWLEARGRPAGETLASLVAKFGTETTGLSCLTETREGCAPPRPARRAGRRSLQ